jgi:hypothetical protein
VAQSAGCRLRRGVPEVFGGTGDINGLETAYRHTGGPNALSVVRAVLAPRRLILPDRCGFNQFKAVIAGVQFIDGIEPSGTSPKLPNPDPQ